MLTKRRRTRLRKGKPEESWELESLRFYRAELGFEFELLNQRVSSFVTSQAFLLGAFAVAIGLSRGQFEFYFVHVIAGFGILISFLISFGIKAARRTIHSWLLRQRELLADHAGRDFCRLRSPRDEAWITAKQKWEKTAKLYRPKSRGKFHHKWCANWANRYGFRFRLVAIVACFLNFIETVSDKDEIGPRYRHLRRFGMHMKSLWFPTVLPFVTIVMWLSVIILYRMFPLGPKP